MSYLDTAVLGVKMTRRALESLAYDFVEDGVNEQDLYLLAVKFEALRIALNIKEINSRLQQVRALLQMGPFPQGTSEGGIQDAGEVGEVPIAVNTAPTPLDNKKQYLETAVLDLTLNAEQLVDQYLTKIQIKPSYGNLFLYAAKPSQEGYIAKLYRDKALKALRNAAQFGYCCKRDDSHAQQTDYAHYVKLNDSAISATIKSTAITLISLGLVYGACLLLVTDGGEISGKLAEQASKIFGFLLLVLFYADAKYFKLDLSKELFVRPFCVAGEANKNANSYGTRQGYFTDYSGDKPADTKNLLETAHIQLDRNPQPDDERRPVLSA